MSKTLPETSSASIALLRGSQGYHVASLLSFVLSIVVVFGGIFSVEANREQRLLAMISTLFLISTTFTLAKTMRDRLQGRLWDAPLLAGTTAWMFQCWISFGIAIVATAYAALSVNVPWSVRGFVLLGLGFALSSSVSLAKLVRDHQDADYFAPTATASSSHDALTIELLRETIAVHLPLTWGFFVVNLLSFFGALIQFDLDTERMDLLVMGVFFMVYSALLLAKAVRDSMSSKHVLHPSSAHWLMYGIAPVLSTGLTLDTLVRVMPLSAEHRAFLILNVTSLLSVTFDLAKLVRDRQEVGWLESLPKEEEENH